MEPNCDGSGRNESQTVAAGAESEVTAMHRTPIESKAITSIAYDLAEQRLEILFQDGGVYQYRDFPPDVYRQFLAADSKGQYFNKTIRGRFAHVRPKIIQILS
jgi:hypothetical protein